MLIYSQPITNSALQSCLPSSEHQAGCFIPCSRYTEQDIQNALDIMNNALQQTVPAVLHVQTFYHNHVSIAKSELQSTILRIPTEQLKVAEFRYYLAKRIPIVITGLNRRLQLSWSPAHLIRDHGGDLCSLEDCEEKEKSVKRPLKTFLGRFMNVDCDDVQDSLPQAVWRIKAWTYSLVDILNVTVVLQDWPPKARLVDSHPKLYQDFALALPIPEYTRKDGFYNLAAHFPVNATAQPDLGISLILSAVQAFS